MPSAPIKMFFLTDPNWPPPAPGGGPGPGTLLMYGVGKMILWGIFAWELLKTWKQ